MQAIKQECNAVLDQLRKFVDVTPQDENSFVHRNIRRASSVNPGQRDVVSKLLRPLKVNVRLLDVDAVCSALVKDDVHRVKSDITKLTGSSPLAHLINKLAECVATLAHCMFLEERAADDPATFVRLLPPPPVVLPKSPTPINPDHATPSQVSRSTKPGPHRSETQHQPLTHAPDTNAKTAGHSKDANVRTCPRKTDVAPRSRIRPHKSSQEKSEKDIQAEMKARLERHSIVIDTSHHTTPLGDPATGSPSHPNNASTTPQPQTAAHDAPKPAVDTQVETDMETSTRPPKSSQDGVTNSSNNVDTPQPAPKLPVQPDDADSLCITEDGVLPPPPPPCPTSPEMQDSPITSVKVHLDDVRHSPLFLAITASAQHDANVKGGAQARLDMDACATSNQSDHRATTNQGHHRANHHNLSADPQRPVTPTCRAQEIQSESRPVTPPICRQSHAQNNDDTKYVCENCAEDDQDSVIGVVFQEAYSSPDNFGPTRDFFTPIDCSTNTTPRVDSTLDSESGTSNHHRVMSDDSPRCPPTPDRARPQTSASSPSGEATDPPRQVRSQSASASPSRELERPPQGRDAQTQYKRMLMQMMAIERKRRQPPNEAPAATSAGSAWKQNSPHEGRPSREEGEPKTAPRNPYLHQALHDERQRRSHKGEPPQVAATPTPSRGASCDPSGSPGKPLHKLTPSNLFGAEPVEECYLGRLISHGIRLAVTEVCHQVRRDIIEDDYSKTISHTPFLEIRPGQDVQYSLKDFSPLVFSDLRQSVGVDNAAFLHSISSFPLSGGELGEGKSGAIFFRSFDDKFILKEVRPQEREVLTKVLPSYHRYMLDNPYSFLPQILGLYTIKGKDIREVSLVVMRNILYCGRVEQDEDGEGCMLEQIHEVYDLKGSVINRFTKNADVVTGSGGGPIIKQRRGSTATEVDDTEFCVGGNQEGVRPTRRSNSMCEGHAWLNPPTRHPDVPSRPPTAQSACKAPKTPSRITRRNSAPSVLKDLNLHCRFKLGSERKLAVMTQLNSDASFLESHNIMDYSLLLGVKSIHHSFDNTPGSIGQDSVTSSHYEESEDGDELRDRTTSLPELTLDIGDSPNRHHHMPLQTPLTELHAMFQRARDSRYQGNALLPEGVTVDLRLCGHGISRRSRDSSTMFRSKCTVYAWRVTKIEPVEGFTENGPSFVGGGGHDGGSPPPYLDGIVDDEIGDQSPGKVKTWVIFRRYKEFEALHEALDAELRSECNYIQIPALPNKQRVGFMKEGFVKQRETELDRWLHNILELVEYRGGENPALRKFLTMKANIVPDGLQLESVVEGLNPILSTSHNASSGGASREFFPPGTDDSASPPSTQVVSPTAHPGGYQGGDESTPQQQPFLKKQLSGKQTSSSMNLGTLEHRYLAGVLSADDRELWEERLGGREHRWIDANRVTRGHKGRPPVYLFFGIIDVLQAYNMSKKLETFYKGFTSSADGISAVEPSTYKKRFMDFVNKYVFTK